MTLIRSKMNCFALQVCFLGNSICSNTKVHFSIAGSCVEGI
jgi:hypothetical protein